MEFTVDRWMGYSRWGSDVEDRSLLSNVAESVHRPDRRGDSPCLVRM
jgi:hypothetical protein